MTPPRRHIGGPHLAATQQRKLELVANVARQVW
jgi:hypothetical protein